MKRGATLIELIVVLLLVGVLAVSATVALVPVSEAFLQVKQNSESAQSVAFAVARLNREFSSVTNVVSGTANSLTYDLLDGQGVGHRRTLAWSPTPGAPLTLDGVPLLDGIRKMAFQYYTAPGGASLSVWTPGCCEIEVVFAPAFPDGVYVLRVRPRNVR